MQWPAMREKCVHNRSYFCKSIINSFYSPSSSNVASVSRFNLLLRQDSGIPLLETVVNGTKQSGKKVLELNF